MRYIFLVLIFLFNIEAAEEAESVQRYSSPRLNPQQIEDLKGRDIVITTVKGLGFLDFEKDILRLINDSKNLNYTNTNYKGKK